MTKSETNVAIARRLQLFTSCLRLDLNYASSLLNTGIEFLKQHFTQKQVHCYEEIEAIPVKRAQFEEPVLARIIAVVDLALAKNPDTNKTDLQVIVKLAPHAAEFLGFTYGRTTMYQMA